MDLVIPIWDVRCLIPGFRSSKFSQKFVYNSLHVLCLTTLSVVLEICEELAPPDCDGWDTINVPCSLSLNDLWYLFRCRIYT